MGREEASRESFIDFYAEYFTTRLMLPASIGRIAAALMLSPVPLSQAQLREIRGVRVAYVAQSAAAAFNPAHRLNAQVTEAAVRHGIMAPDQALQEAKRLYAKLRLPTPERFGERYPHQVSGGQLQRAKCMRCFQLDATNAGIIHVHRHAVVEGIRFPLDQVFHFGAEHTDAKAVHAEFTTAQRQLHAA